MVPSRLLLPPHRFDHYSRHRTQGVSAQPASRSIPTSTALRAGSSLASNQELAGRRLHGRVSHHLESAQASTSARAHAHGLRSASEAGNRYAAFREIASTRCRLTRR